MYKCLRCGKEYYFPIETGTCPYGCDSKRLKEIYPWLFKNNSGKKDKKVEKMERLTTNKDKSEMGMCELAHNSCYVKDGVARYRDYESDIDARDLTRELAWSLADIELSRNDDEFDEEMLDNLQYDIKKEPIGLIALFYRNLWAMADLREKLKRYEDEEEQGLLMRFPCKPGDVLYILDFQEIYSVKATSETGMVQGKPYVLCKGHNYVKMVFYDEIGQIVFFTQQEAEQKLKELEGHE